VTGVAVVAFALVLGGMFFVKDRRDRNADGEHGAPRSSRSRGSRGEKSASWWTHLVIQSKYPPNTMTMVMIHAILSSVFLFLHQTDVEEARIGKHEHERGTCIEVR
jgi:hypothetical protein